VDELADAAVRNLLADISAEGGISYVLISHDLAVVRQITDHAIVMRRERVVEQEPARKPSRRESRAG
jgi:oligopeptide transport system ATP-binding protein